MYPDRVRYGPRRGGTTRTTGMTNFEPRSAIGGHP
jgi:hypothetical protein